MPLNSRMLTFILNPEQFKKAAPGGTYFPVEGMVIERGTTGPARTR